MDSWPSGHVIFDELQRSRHQTLCEVNEIFICNWILCCRVGAYIHISNLSEYLLRKVPELSR